MGEEYRKWCEQHPNATDEEQQEAFERYFRMLEVRNLVGCMLLSLRNN